MDELMVKMLTGKPWNPGTVDLLGHLRAHLAEGATNAAALYQEIKALGYHGTQSGHKATKP